MSILLNNPDNNDVINFVMNVGKWHYASHKPAKEYTVNDLQFVQSQLAEIQKLKLLSNHLKHEDALGEVIQISESFKIEELNIYSAPSDPVGKKYIEEKIEFLEHLINFLIKQVEINPIDKKLQDALIASLKKHPSIEHTRIYQSILNFFESSVNQQGLKILVLEVGRWHFGRQRFWGKANANDEQTIQNDILVRTRNN